MKRWIYALAVALVTLSTATACHRPTTIVTEPGKKAFTADQILVRVNELQKAAIQAEANGSMKTEDARVVIGWTVSAAKICKETPNGWQTTLSTLWATVKTKIPAQPNPAIAALLSSIDVLLAAQGGQ